MDESVKTSVAEVSCYDIMDESVRISVAEVSCYDIMDESVRISVAEVSCYDIMDESVKISVADTTFVTLQSMLLISSVHRSGESSQADWFLRSCSAANTS
jgi:hypothetical protein